MADLRASRHGMDDGLGTLPLLDPKTPGVLEHGGKKFAVGLLWLTVDDASVGFSGQKGLAQVRRDLIKPDFICERSQIIAQHGYGHLSKGHRIGMPVAAASAADILVGEWHGVFAADNGWWYVAVHGDAIAPEGDRFFTSEEEAYQYFTTAASTQRWPRTYAPKEWAIAGASHEITLAKLLGGLSGVFLQPYTLDSFFGNAVNKFITLGALSFLAVLMVVFFASGLSSYLSYPPTPQKIVAPTTIPQIIAAPPKITPAFGDDNKLLEIEDFPPPLLITACLERFEDLFRALPGWRLASMTCAGGNVIGEWSRGTARFADLNKLRRLFSPDVVMTYDGQGKLIVTEPLDISQVPKIKMQVGHKEVLYGILTSRLETKGDLAVTETEVQPEIPPAVGGVAPDPASIPPAERFLSVTFKSPLSAYMWIDDFDIPGMKPLELKWSVPESSWSMTGLVKYQ